MSRIITVGKGATISLDVVNKLLVFMVVLAVAPICCYYLTKFVAEEYMNVSEENSNIPSAVSAIFGVWLVMGLYVYIAFTEEDDDDENSEDKKREEKKPGEKKDE
eukprot:m.98743 g.98743  ORF g.98743 m.98743 type:complete len:105 (+) comp13645_c2_seq1:1602-1916(+)